MFAADLCLPQLADFVYILTQLEAALEHATTTGKSGVVVECNRTNELHYITRATEIWSNPVFLEHLYGDFQALQRNDNVADYPRLKLSVHFPNDDLPWAVFKLLGTTTSTLPTMPPPSRQLAPKLGSNSISPESLPTVNSNLRPRLPTYQEPPHATVDIAPLPTDAVQQGLVSSAVLLHATPSSAGVPDSKELGIEYKRLDMLGSKDLWRSDRVSPPLTTPGGVLAHYTGDAPCIPALGNAAAPLLARSHNVLLGERGDVAEIHERNLLMRETPLCVRMLRSGFERLGDGDNILAVPISASTVDTLRKAKTDPEITDVAHDVMRILAKGGLVPRDFVPVKYSITKPTKDASSVNARRTLGFDFEALWHVSFNCSGISEAYRCPSYATLLVRDAPAIIEGPDGHSYDKIYLLLRNCVPKFDSGEGRNKKRGAGDAGEGDAGEGDGDAAIGNSTTGSVGALIGNNSQTTSSGKHATKKWRPSGPYTSTSYLQCEKVHESSTGRMRPNQAGIMTAKVGATAAGMDHRPTAPSSLLNAVASIASPGTVKSGNPAVLPNKGQLQRSSSQAQRSKAATTTGNDVNDLMAYARVSANSNRIVESYLPDVGIDLRDRPADSYGKVHGVTVKPIQFHISSPRMALAAKMAARSTRALLADHTRGLIRGVDGQTPDSLQTVAAEEVGWQRMGYLVGCSPATQVFP